MSTRTYRRIWLSPDLILFFLLVIITIWGCSSGNESGKNRDTTEEINLTYLKLDSAGPQDPWAKFCG